MNFEAKRNFARDERSSPAVLVPYDPAEAISTSEAAALAGKSQRTIREWCCLHRIGRRIAGRWAVSAVALDMFLNGDDGALDLYLAGDRCSDEVVGYYAQRDLPSTGTES